jgi:hypothetical protein
LPSLSRNCSIVSVFALKICADQCKSAAEKGFPLRSSVVRLRVAFAVSGPFGLHGSAIAALNAEYFFAFLQPCWEGCQLKQHKTVARAECSPETAP